MDGRKIFRRNALRWTFRVSKIGCCVPLFFCFNFHMQTTTGFSIWISKVSQMFIRSTVLFVLVCFNVLQIGCASHKNTLLKSPAGTLWTWPVVGDTATVKLDVKVYSGETSYHFKQHDRDDYVFYDNWIRMFGCDDENNPACRVKAGQSQSESKQVWYHYGFSYLCLVDFPDFADGTDVEMTLSVDNVVWYQCRSHGQKNLTAWTVIGTPSDRCRVATDMGQRSLTFNPFKTSKY